jgi:hypothetical protein
MTAANLWLALCILAGAAALVCAFVGGLLWGRADAAVRDYNRGFDAGRAQGWKDEQEKQELIRAELGRATSSAPEWMRDRSVARN